MILQRFTLVDHTGYKLKIKEALTIKPEGFKIRAVLRDPATRPRGDTAVRAAGAGRGRAARRREAAGARATAPRCWCCTAPTSARAEDLARQLAEAGEMRGFSTQLASLDDYAERLPAEGAVAIVCASYNGMAPDNAAEFHRWLDEADDSLNGVRFSVFGCGNTDWASTYQAVPRRIDERLAALGATRIHARGEGDAREDMDGAFQDWATRCGHSSRGLRLEAGRRHAGAERAALHAGRTAAAAEERAGRCRWARWHARHRQPRAAERRAATRRRTARRGTSSCSCPRA